jgi:voltage-gated potassium channel
LIERGNERPWRRGRQRRSRLQERTARAAAGGRVFPYLALVTAGLAIVSGVVARVVDPHDFHSVGEGIWWAIVTLATVGYGDVVPETPWGRVVGSVVIVFGVTFIAFLTATVTSYFVSSQQEQAATEDRERRQVDEEEDRRLLREILGRLEAIEAALDERREPSRPPS